MCIEDDWENLHAGEVEVEGDAALHGDAVVLDVGLVFGVEAVSHVVVPAYTGRDWSKPDFGDKNCAQSFGFGIHGGKQIIYSFCLELSCIWL